MSTDKTNPGAPPNDVTDPALSLEPSASMPFSDLETGLGRAVERMARIAVVAVRQKHSTLAEKMGHLPPFDGDLGEALPPPTIFPHWKLRAAYIAGSASLGNERRKLATGPYFLSELLLLENGEWWELRWVGRWNEAWASVRLVTLAEMSGCVSLVDAIKIDDWFVPSHFPMSDVVEGLERAFLFKGQPTGELARQHQAFCELAGRIAALAAPREVIRSLKWLDQP